MLLNTKGIIRKALLKYVVEYNAKNIKYNAYKIAWAKINNRTFFHFSFKIIWINCVLKINLFSHFKRLSIKSILSWDPSVILILINVFKRVIKITCCLILDWSQESVVDYFFISLKIRTNFASKQNLKINFQFKHYKWCSESRLMWSLWDQGSLIGW